MGFTFKQKLNRIYVSSKIIYFIESDMKLIYLRLDLMMVRLDTFKMFLMELSVSLNRLNQRESFSIETYTSRAIRGKLNLSKNF